MPELSQDQFEFILQFIHAEKILGMLPVVNDTTVAALFGITAAEYRAVRDKISDRARTAARELLSEPKFAAKIDSLPIHAEYTVVGVGDSFTDDDQSWLEILRFVLQSRFSQCKLNIVNSGVSTQTSTHIVARFQEVIALQPDLVVFFFGTNDAQRIDACPDKTLVGIEESNDNFELLNKLVRSETAADVIWFTPTGILEGRIAKHWMLGNTGSSWLSTDVERVAERIRAIPETVVDLTRVFGEPPRGDLLLEDGLHPSLSGHKLIVKELVDVLATKG